MNIKEMNNIDLSLRLLGKRPISLSTGNINVYPKLVREVDEVGYSTYSKFINIILLNKEDLFSSEEELSEEIKTILDDDRINIFDLIVRIEDYNFVQLWLNALEFFLNEKCLIHPIDDDIRIVVVGDYEDDDISYEDIKIINRDNYNELIQVIKFQSYIESPEEIEDFNPENEEDRALWEQMRKDREMIKKAKAKRNGGGNSNVNFSSIVSAVGTRSNSCNKDTVFDLTIYQLYDEYTRLGMHDNYNISLKAMFNGAKDVEITNWASIPEND